MHFKPLEHYYKSFAHSHESGKRNYVLEITDGEAIKAWGHNELMECFTISNLFALWNWTNNGTVCLYFDTLEQSKLAMYLMKSRHPNVQVSVREAKYKA